MYVSYFEKNLYFTMYVSNFEKNLNFTMNGHLDFKVLQ